jgi:CheY-like chemotaxis protein
MPSRLPRARKRRRLRFNPVHSTTPIVALTAYTDPSDLERARAAGCNGKIAKPIDTATFAHEVAYYMNRAEIRNSFLAEGLERCNKILKDLKSGRGCAIEVIQRVLHRWAGLGGTLGFPEISDHARRVDALLTSASPEYDEIERSIETIRRWFSDAAHNKPRLPLELITGLRNARIGLVNFSEEEANRIRTAAHRAHVQVVIEHVKSKSIEKQMEYTALIINECAVSSRAAFDRPQLSVPAVFILSRSSLQSLSKLPLRAYDFLIAPWDAEEVLIRVYRLIARAAPPQPVNSSHPQKSRPRVLIADDDPSIVAIVAETLQQCEMDCDIARGGNQALEAVHRRPPTAIVLDVNMTGRRA